MTEYDVFANFSGIAHMKVNARSYKEAAEKAEMEVNGYFVNPNVNIQTMDGKNHGLYVDDVNIEYSKDNPNEFNED
ncbi:hypothetical protein OYT88_02265 [Sporolactobacillus sp. CQH2019]|uniref:hypothetical protein n=1 Tax=Sporolactobacillus sp. CQH2019 TaxID=3023512 RepID=UPI002367FF00|nr:hypothetical protein [Sporolactobacillus sp. CQH2019]MDD9147374.1 hypothetical protein [Sporolactobacillus sp. CQH2019]